MSTVPFHSFTGCDTTPSFLGIGKKTAWAAWQAYADLTETLLTLSDDPTLLTLDSIHMARLECWTVVMYSKSSGCSMVNDVRRQLFTHGTRTLDHTHTHTHPTQEALLQHAKRVLYQAGYIWRHARQRPQDVPDASAWGWTQDVNTKLRVPFWTCLHHTP